MTRDNAIWWFGIVGSVVVGIATLGADAAQYGIPEAWLPYVRLAALVVGIVSGKLASSPLKHSNPYKNLL